MSLRLDFDSFNLFDKSIEAFAVRGNHTEDVRGPSCNVENPLALVEHRVSLGLSQIDHNGIAEGINLLKLFEEFYEGGTSLSKAPAIPRSVSFLSELTIRKDNKIVNLSLVLGLPSLRKSYIPCSVLVPHFAPSSNEYLLKASNPMSLLIGTGISLVSKQSNEYIVLSEGHHGTKEIANHG